MLITFIASCSLSTTHRHAVNAFLTPHLSICALPLSCPPASPSALSPIRNPATAPPRLSAKLTMKPTPQHHFSNLTIGVLELQGDFAEHTAMLRRCGAGKVTGVRETHHLQHIDALVIPGGESTVISKLLVDLKLMQPIQKLVAENALPVFGTCAGCILLAAQIKQRNEQARIGVLDVVVDRNAYGSQIHSFEVHLRSNRLPFIDAPPLRAVHIRAPAIVHVGERVDVLATFNHTPVLVRQGNILACTFHPELTEDTRIHKLFLEMVAQHKR